MDGQGVPGTNDGQADSERLSLSLGAIQETALITLWARAAEQKRKRPAFVDQKALEIVRRIDFDFERFRRAWGTQLGVRLRTLEFDATVRQFSSLHPNGAIVELGAGLNTRFERVATRTNRWFEVDLSDIVELRRSLMEERRDRSLLVGSIGTDDWLSALDISETTPVLFLVEGVTMYLPSSLIVNFLQKVGSRFANTTVKFDALGQLAVRQQHRHDLHREIRAAFYSSWPEINDDLVSDRACQHWTVTETLHLRQILTKYRRVIGWPLKVGALCPVWSMLPALRDAYFYVTLNMRTSA